MNQPTTATLVIDKNIKGHLPVTNLAVSDSAGIMIALPDEYQTRLYHLVRLSPDGEWTEVAAFSMEKPSRTDSAAEGQVFAAATDDKVYVFSNGVKSRFFSNRRDIYTDISVSASGELLAVGSADMTASGHSVTLARTAGGEIWIKNFPHTVTGVRISSDGTKILVGSDEGNSALLDTSRRLLWQMDGEDPVTALAISKAGEASVLLTRDGSVSVISAEGERLWRLEDVGYGKAVAVSGDGRIIGAVHVSHDGTERVTFYSTEGTPLFDYDTTQRIRSIACSPDGRYFALSCEDGTLQVLQISLAASEVHPADKAQGLFCEGCALAEKGDTTGALEKLAELLRLSPRDTEACGKLAELRADMVKKALDDSERMEGDLPAAFGSLKSATAHAPYDPDLFERMLLIRGRLIAEHLQAAGKLKESDAFEEGIELMKYVIELDDTNSEARRELGELEDRLCARYLSESASALTDGIPEKAVELLEKAAAIQPSSDLQEHLLKARVAQAMREGIELYQAKHYSQAILLFKKALSIDPQNPDAAKYIEYAQNLRQDDALFDRFSKLE